MPADSVGPPSPPAGCTHCTRPNCPGGDAHQPNGVYLGCRECGIELNDVRPLLLNPATRSKSTCELCGLRYRKDTYAALHFRSHFSELSTAAGPLLCVQCIDHTGTDDGFKTPATPRATAAADDDDDDDTDSLAMQDVEMLDYECDLCDEPTELFLTLQTLDEHKLCIHGVWSEHDGEDRPMNSAASDEDHKPARPHPPAFVCKQCNKQFTSRNKLSYHRAKVHPTKQRTRGRTATGRTDTDAAAADAADNENVIYCRICENDDDDAAAATFENRAELRAHEDAVHRDASTARFPCGHCDRDYSCVSFLALHLIKHTKQKRFACDVCGKHFGRLAHMQYHRSTHTEERTFECERCADGKAFKTEASLKRHLVHMHPVAAEAVRRYPCELCDKVFKDSSDRRRHRWTHGGFERRYACTLCEKRFFEMKGLRAHQRTHERKGELSVVVGVQMEDGETADVECVAAEEVVAS